MYNPERTVNPAKREQDWRSLKVNAAILVCVVVGLGDQGSVLP